jgi:putative transcriptional regulator
MEQWPEAHLDLSEMPAVVAYAEGKADESACRIAVPGEDRRKADPSTPGHDAEEFAGRLGFSVNTLRHWEQGPRQPEGPTRAYFLVVERAA